MPWEKVAQQVAGPLLSAGASIFGSNKASSASKDASKVQKQASDDALAFSREQEATRRKEYEAMVAAEKEQWEAEQLRLDPYRQASLGILGGAASRLGYDLNSVSPAAKKAVDVAEKSKFTVPTSAFLPGGENSITPDLDVPKTGYAPPSTLMELAKIRRSGDWREARRG